MKTSTIAIAIITTLLAGAHAFADEKPKPAKKDSGGLIEGDPFGGLRELDKGIDNVERGIKGDKPAGDKPAGDKPAGDKPAGNKPAGDKPAGNKPAGDKPGGDKPGGDKPGGDKPGSDKPGSVGSPVSAK